MLKAYPLMLEVLRLLRPVLTQIERHDRDLGTTRYRTALGSARETGACLDVAMALGYVERVEPELLGKLDQVRAIMARVVM